MSAQDREICPVAKTAEIISGKWTLLIIRDLATGTKRFNELERSLARISPKTLSERLRDLEEAGILRRQTFAEVPVRVEYSLTEKGRALIPVIEAMREYGQKWLMNECGEPAAAGNKGPARARHQDEVAGPPAHKAVVAPEADRQA